MSWMKHHYFNEINGLDQYGNPADPCLDQDRDPGYQEWSETIEQQNQQHQDEAVQKDCDQMMQDHYQYGSGE
jgi:hypothetical protein